MKDRRLMTMLRALPFVLAVMVFSWVEPAAAAPAGSSRAKRFRLHADTEFFGFTHFDDRSDNPSDSNLVGFGIGRPTLLDSGVCAGGGLGRCVLSVRPTWGLGFGYAFAEQRAVVGARFAFTVDGVFFPNADDTFTLVGGQFVPYFRWIFLPGQTFRPYVEGRFGLGGGSIAYRDDEGDERGRTGIIYPTVGFGGGLHIFIVDAFSFDLGLNFDYVAPHSRSRLRSPNPIGGGFVTVERDWEQDYNIINIGALAGFSIWFD